MPVIYRWKQSTGQLMIGEHAIATGYAGAPGHINITEDEVLKGRGPLPRGWYEITQIYPTHPKTGPNSIVLTPDKKNKMFGRDGFMIHGDSIQKPGTASEGCIILGFSTRRLFRLGDRIEVI